MILVAGVISPPAALAQAPIDTQPLGKATTACRFDAVGEGEVASIIDGRSFVLADGREVRLAALDVPVPRAGETGARAAAADAAKRALESILAKRSIALSGARAASDRYGRTLAFVDVINDGPPRAVGHAMVAGGYARVAGPVETMACATELLSQERAARAAKLGLWADPYYVIFAAEGGPALLAEQGRFTVAEGKVLSVRESGGIIYLNFGRRWSQALTVTISKRHERIFAAAGMSPGKLENRRIRVRGWIDERNGPRIEATRPEQIEIAELN